MWRAILGSSLAVIVAAITSLAVTAAVPGTPADAHSSKVAEPIAHQEHNIPMIHETVPIRVILPAPWESAPQSR
jgi:hypothetical protein